jgi:hypothetical protein
VFGEGMGEEEEGDGGEEEGEKEDENEEEDEDVVIEMGGSLGCEEDPNPYVGAGLEGVRPEEEVDEAEVDENDKGEGEAEEAEEGGVEVINEPADLEPRMNVALRLASGESDEI